MEEGKGLRSLNCEVVGEVAQVTVKSPWQEPAVFSLTLPLLTEDMILALTGQFKQLSLEPEKFR